MTSVNAHSWVEDMHVIAKNGTYVGAPGYPRAFAKRGPGVNPDKEMVHLLPPNGRANKILDSDPMCMPSQQQPKQSDGSPMLTAAPGDMVALRYQENGHVTLPENQPGKASNRGTVYIYGTTSPKPDEKFLSIHKVWNPEGTGGDKRGKLLATEPYDDGQCYQVNGGPISSQRQSQFKHDLDPVMGKDVWCQNNLLLPEDAKSGKPYTLYWVWDWDTAQGATAPQGLVEKYTTCMDISVTQSPGQSKVDSTAAKFAQGQNLNSAAIPKYVEQLNAGSGIYVPGSVNSDSSSGGASSAPAPASSAPLPAVSKPASSAMPIPPLPQSSAPAAAGPATVTVTSPGSEKTVTVTAAGQAVQSASAQAIDSPSAQVTMSVSITQITDTPTVFVTAASSMQTNIPAASAAPNQASSITSAAGATPVTVSGVVIPTMTGNRFTGTANPAPSAGPQSANPPTASNNKRCTDCKPAKRSVILGGGATSAKHATAHVNKARSLRNAGSAKFRL
ncbi:MAG: hypothetical protein Q9207_005440 [Kuettlingeria erythrocarpa]